MTSIRIFEMMNVAEGLLDTARGCSHTEEKSVLFFRRPGGGENQEMWVEYSTDTDGSCVCTFSQINQDTKLFLGQEILRTDFFDKRQPVPGNENSYFMSNEYSNEMNRAIGLIKGFRKMMV